MRMGKKDKIQEICLLDVGAIKMETIGDKMKMRDEWRRNGDKMETKTKMTEMETNRRTIGDEISLGRNGRP